ncbi:Protein pelota-like protein [Bienertia sinuspersici]
MWHKGNTAIVVSSARLRKIQNRALKREVSNFKEKLDSIEVDNVFLAKQASELKVKLRFTNGPESGGVGFMFCLLVAVILGGVIVTILG